MTHRPSAPASSPRRCARPEGARPEGTGSGEPAGGPSPLGRLGVAARRLAPELASRAAVRRAERLLAGLPGDLSENLIFECRLGADAGRLDVSFRFDRPLEDSQLRWLRWDGESFVPFRLPAVGEQLEIRPRGAWIPQWLRR